MAICDVYHNSPGQGPGQMSAQSALEAFIAQQPNWNIRLNWSVNRSIYTATPDHALTVTGEQLQTLVERKFSPQTYLIAATD